MSAESSPIHEMNDTATAAVAADLERERTNPPWISCIAIAACISIFLGLALQNDIDSWDALAKFGYLPADAIWSGGYWSLISSAFIHFTLLHVAFNVYWLWVLGSRLERAIGSMQFLAFYIASAFVSSSFQLALSDSTGVGASGVVYAIFGFMWITRHRYSHFNEVLDVRTIQIFLIWLVVCVFASYLEVWDVGNAAHISGLLFGGTVAGAFVVRRNQRLVRTAFVTFIVLAVIPLFWCPWSVTWLSLKAYQAHAAKRYHVALARYAQIINIDPENAWAYLNRSFVYQALDQSQNAQADLLKARQMDPLIESRKITGPSKS